MRLRGALAELVSAGAVTDPVREDIGASWRRSVAAGLRPDSFAVPYSSDVDRDGLLVRTARPVLEELARDLDAVRMGVFVTDAQANVLDRRVSGPSMHSRLDRISLAPGFLYAEQAVGTNAIGTALAQRAPAMVEGPEHFADDLTSMACAAAPVADPQTGRILGAVDLTCAAHDASPLMLALARRAAREIEQRLVDDVRIGERALLQRFLRERRGAKGPMVLVNERTMLANAAADRLVDPADESVLRECAIQLLARTRQESMEVTLRNGVSVAVRGEPVLDVGALPGALLRLTPRSSVETGSDGQYRRFGWESLTDTERSVIDLVVQGLTNREAGGRLFLSHHTVGFHLRSIFRKLDVNSRVDLARVALEHASRIA